jgi:hypothetical protein
MIKSQINELTGTDQPMRPLSLYLHNNAQTRFRAKKVSYKMVTARSFPGRNVAEIYFP